MKRLSVAIVFLALLLCVIGCGKKHYVLGSPELNDGDVQKTNAGKVKLTFMRYIDTAVTLDLTFATKLNTTPREGYVALLTRSEYGPFYVLIKQDLYTDTIDKLELGDTITVYGRISASKLPTDDMNQMTVVIDM